MITGVIGKPRSGKTTYSAMISYKNHRKQVFIDKFKNDNFKSFLIKLLKPYSVIYCTDPTIQFTQLISYPALGMWRPEPGSLLILEEAGIGLNNREWKKTSEYAQHLFALHGHIGCDILWSSQTVDVDKKLLDRTHLIYLCRKGLFGHRSVMDLITFEPGVNQETKKLENMYSIEKGFAYFLARIFHKHFTFNRKPYYKYFNSYVDDFIYPYNDPC